MRKYISFILSAIAAVLMTGCVDLAVTPIGPDSPAKVKLQLTNADLVATRAVTDDDQFNEDLIKSVQCFFAATDADAVTYATDIITLPENTKQNASLDIELPAEVITPLFGTSTSCDVYVVANYGSELTDETITAIKAKTITLGTGATQKSFVMDGKAVVSLNGTSLKGTVNLIRAAAKVVVKVNLKNSVTEGGVVWTSAPAAIKMTYTGSVNGSKISATAADANAATAVTYTQTTGVFTQDTEVSTAAGKYVGYQATPFYSFPVSAEANEGVINMVIPWTPEEGSEIEYNYQIPIDIAFERNNVYVIEVNVGMLGTLDGAELTPSYVVVDWTENAINTSLSRPKYLVVQQHHYELNNETSLEIPFSSSDVCKISFKNCTQINLLDNSISEINEDEYALTIDNENGVLSLTHTLNNNLYDDNFDFTPYEFSITIQHTNNSQFAETITITQYPAIYGYGDKNSDADNDNDTNGDNGFVWVNGYQGAYYEYGIFGNPQPKYTQSNFDDAEGSTDSSLKAVSMYVFTVSSLEGTKYIIGDPRTKEPDNLTEYSFKWGEGKVLGSEDVRSTPLYYLPTDADLADGTDSPTYNMIAPKFRVCSVYGAIDTNGARQYYKNMKGRCASYQEDGYPAGRWRLPTAAEFELINTLSMKKLLPALYATTMDYWCAHGYGKYDTVDKVVEITPNDDDYGSRSVSVRCVYDDWYWGSERALTTEEEKNVFTWGDQPR